MHALRADLPPDIDRIISRCLEKDPERRAQTAKDVRNELELVRRAEGSGASGAPRHGAPDTASAPDVPSVAVLPFANRGRDEDDEYFADGITEDVIAQLCKVRTLKVISRMSVMPFKKRDESLQEIASRLQVANVLEGSVRRLGDRVRIVAQLIDAASGRHLWAETYDRQLTDIFAIQTDVALHIADALKAELSPNERERIRREPTRDVAGLRALPARPASPGPLHGRGHATGASSTSTGRSSATPTSPWPTSGSPWRTRSSARTGR